MKLLVVSHTCATPVNQQLYASIKQATGWDMTIVVPANWRNEYGRELPAERWGAFDGQLISVPVRRPGDIILHTYRTSFAKLIRDEDPDVVYVNHEPYAAATAQVYWGNLRAGGRAKRRPIGFYSAQNIYKKYPPPFRWTEAWVMRTSGFALPISATVDGVLRRKGYRGASTIFPLAVEPDVYDVRPNPDGVRRELFGDGIPHDAVVLGYVGRFVPEKGLATLMAAMRKLGDLNWRLVMVGAGPMEGELRRLVGELRIDDRVAFAGFVPHVEAPRILSALDALVLPSETQPNWREQFGRVILEAMACGTPVVGSDSGEIPELIRDTGGGLVFREGDADDLARALRQIITDAGLRQNLARAGRAAVADRYTVASVVAAFVKAIETTASSDQSRNGPDRRVTSLGTK